MPLHPFSAGDPELDLIDDAVKGVCRDLHKRAVRAEVLRVLLIRTHDPAIPKEFYETNCHRWRIKGAVFKECLNLSDGRLLDGGALPAMEFTDCTFEEGFCADNAHLERLSFKDCEFGTPKCDPCAPVPDVRPKEDVCELQVQPSGEGNDTAQIEEPARQPTENRERSQAPAEVTAPEEPSRAVTEAMKDKEPDCTPEPKGQNQISLRNVRILGELRMDGIKPFDKSSLLRVDARSARVGASVILRDSTLKAPRNEKFIGPLGTTYALNLRAANIHADLFLEPGVQIDGGLILFGAHIGGDIRAHGLTAKDGYDEHCRNLLRPSGELRYAISMQSARVDGNVYAGSIRGSGMFQVEGAFDLGSIHVTGNLRLQACVVDPKSRTAIAIDLRNATLQGSLFLVNGQTLSGSSVKCQIGGLLLLDGAAVNGSLQLEGKVPRLDAVNLSVTGDATISVEADDLIDLSRATIIGQLDLRKLAIKQAVVSSTQTSDGKPGAGLPFAQAQIDERPTKDRPGFKLVDADIKRSLNLGTRSKITYLWHRTAKLSCYQYVTIVEVQAVAEDLITQDKTYPLISFLLRDVGDPIVLDGKSAEFHKLNNKGLLRLDHDEKMKDYLRLFCAYVWGEEGPFRIIERSSQIPSEVAKGKMPAFKEIEMAGTSGDGDTPAKANVLYSSFLFEVNFVIKQDQTLRMSDDEPLCSFDTFVLPTYDSPLQFGLPESCYDAGKWNIVKDETALHAIVPDWKRFFVKKTTFSFADALVDLSDASCGTIDDQDGAAWGTASLMDLTNFTYARISPSKDKSFTRIEHVQRLRDAEDVQSTRCTRLVNEHRSSQCKNKVVQIRRDKRPWWQKPFKWWIWLACARLRKPGENFARKVGIFGMWEALRKRCDVFVKNLLVGQDHFTRERTREARRASYTLRLLRDRPGWRRVGKLWWLLWDEVWLAGRGRSVESLPLPMYLRRQWLANRPAHIEFHPQPYVQLAKVLRDEGDEDSARKIEREKIDLDLDYRLHDARKHHRPVVWLGLFLWKPFYGRGFGYGLSILRATVTLILFWLAGAGFFLSARNHDMLIKSEARVASVQTHSYLQPEVKSGSAGTSQAQVAASSPFPTAPHHARRRPRPHSYCKCFHPGRTKQIRKDPPVSPPQRLVDSVTSAKDGHQTNADSLCGRDINPFLYAVESATPFLNLHQQTRCDIRTPDEKASGIKAYINWSNVWLIFKLGYQIFGYVITSLAVLTFSGIARRWEQK